MQERRAVGENRRQSPLQQIPIQPQKLEFLQRSDGRMDLPSQPIEGEIDEPDVRGRREIARSEGGEVVGREIEVAEEGRERAVDLSGKEVSGEVEDLEVREVADLRREAAGKSVGLEEEVAEAGESGEGGWEGAVEEVGAQAKLVEVAQVSNVGGDGAGEAEAREAELDDVAVGAEDAAPVAGGG